MRRQVTARLGSRHRGHQSQRRLLRKEQPLGRHSIRTPPRAVLRSPVSRHGRGAPRRPACLPTVTMDHQPLLGVRAAVRRPSREAHRRSGSKGRGRRRQARSPQPAFRNGDTGLEHLHPQAQCRACRRLQAADIPCRPPSTHWVPSARGVGCAITGRLTDHESWRDPRPERCPPSPAPLGTGIARRTRRTATGRGVTANETTGAGRARSPLLREAVAWPRPIRPKLISSAGYSIHSRVITTCSPRNPTRRGNSRPVDSCEPKHSCAPSLRAARGV